VWRGHNYLLKMVLDIFFLGLSETVAQTVADPFLLACFQVDAATSATASSSRPSTVSADGPSRRRQLALLQLFVPGRRHVKHELVRMWAAERVLEAERSAAEQAGEFIPTAPALSDLDLVLRKHAALVFYGVGETVELRQLAPPLALPKHIRPPHRPPRPPDPAYKPPPPHAHHAATTPHSADGRPSGSVHQKAADAPLRPIGASAPATPSAHARRPIRSPSRPPSRVLARPAAPLAPLEPTADRRPSTVPAAPAALGFFAPSAALSGGGVMPSPAPSPTPGAMPMPAATSPLPRSHSSMSHSKSHSRSGSPTVNWACGEMKGAPRRADEAVVHAVVAKPAAVAAMPAAAGRAAASRR
jgi:hypothetical protein